MENSNYARCRKSDPNELKYRHGIVAPSKSQEVVAVMTAILVAKDPYNRVQLAMNEALKILQLVQDEVE
jgi:hypothetical protein